MMAQCTFQCPTTYPTNSHLTLPILNTLQMQSLNFEEPSLSTRDSMTHFLKVNMLVSLVVILVNNLDNNNFILYSSWWASRISMLILRGSIKEAIKRIMLKRRTELIMRASTHVVQCEYTTSNLVVILPVISWHM